MKYIIVEFKSEMDAKRVHDREYSKCGKRRVGKYTTRSKESYFVCRPEEFRALSADYDFAVYSDGYAIGYDGLVYDTFTGICMDAVY